MTQDIIVENNDRVLTIQMNRPEKKNALSQVMYAAMADAINASNDDINVRVILIKGSKECFTSGNDIMDFLGAPGMPEESPVVRFLKAISLCKKPIVAAVNGPAIGIGTTMLLHCDLVVAATETKFKLPFASLGLCPELASSYLLPKLIGHQRAAELLILGDSFDTTAALSLGIINKVCSVDEFESAANEFASRITKLPPSAVQASKRLMKKTDEAAVQTAIDEECALFGDLLTAPESQEAMNAFLEKREPDFSAF